MNRLERRAGPPGTRPVCRGRPLGGTAVVERDADGNEAGRTDTASCPACGRFGPTLWIEIDPRPVPRAGTA